MLSLLILFVRVIATTLLPANLRGNPWQGYPHSDVSEVISSSLQQSGCWTRCYQAYTSNSISEGRVCYRFLLDK